MTRRLALAAALVAAGCDSAAPDRAAALPVVSAMLHAGSELPAVYLSRLAPLDAALPPEGVAIAGAEISIVHVASGQAFAYRQSVSQPRRYDPVGGAEPAARVEAGAMYRLVAVVPAAGGRRDTLRAETTVPQQLRVAEPPADGLAYGAGAGPAFRLGLAGAPSGRAVFVFKVAAQQPDAFERVVVDGGERWRARGLPGRYALTDAGRLLNDCERDADGRDVCRWARPATISPPSNEAGYARQPDGTVRVHIPWTDVRFYGPQGVVVYSVDRALARFIATQALQSKPSTLSPGEIPNASTNVENGLGVFGAYATAEFQMAVPPGPTG